MGLAHIRQRNNSALITMFYQNFLFLILEKLIAVMTDTLHKSSFPAMCGTLRSIAADICSNSMIKPLSPNKQESNQQFVARRLSAFIQSKFAHLTSEVIQKFVIGLFALAADSGSDGGKQKQEKYLLHCEDFLVAIRSIHQTEAKQQSRQQENANTNGNGNVKQDDINDDDL